LVGEIYPQADSIVLVMDKVERLEDEAFAWVENRNAKGSKVDWRFTTADALIKCSG
jgi:hypothetical protein